MMRTDGERKEGDMSISSWLLDPKTSHGAVADHLRRRWHQVQNGEYEIAIALRRLFEDNLHRHEGFSRFEDFAESRFGMKDRLAGCFLNLGKHLARLPETRAALEAGDLTYTKAREFVPIASRADEGRWIEFARTHTNRELEREVTRARHGTEHDETEVRSRLRPAEVQVVRKAREIVMKKLEKPVPDAELLPVMAELFVAGAAASGESPPAATVRSPTPYLTINLCPECTRTYVPVPGENLRVPVVDWFEALKAGAEVHDLVADLLCDCEGVKHRRDRCPHEAGRTRSGEPPKSRHVPVEVRKRVEARDGHRCRVPGCRNRVPLEKSHLKPFRDGTPPRPENLAQHCATCNVLIETGRLVVEGEAPLERYYRANGEFVGHGFDPAPHVGNSVRASRKDGADPPRTVSAAG
jgi:hypothetical protein